MRISLLLPRLWVRLSNFDVGQLRRIGQIAPVETLQPQYNEPQLSRNLELVVRLAAVADRHDTTPGAVAVAVAWTLRNPAVDGAIVGFRRPDQVDPILAAAGLELTADDLEEIEGSAR